MSMSMNISVSVSMSMSKNPHNNPNDKGHLHQEGESPSMVAGDERSKFEEHDIQEDQKHVVLLCTCT